MNKTKKSLIMSAMSLLLCISMLIGSTFAWFTDSVTSAGNKIQSGTLKIDLELLDKETGEWNSLKNSQAPIFNYEKWEPGYIDTKVLRVENEGNLALKWAAKFYSEYQLSILADVIDVYVRSSDSEIGYPTDRNLEGYTCVGNLRTFINSIEETTYGTLGAKEVSYLGLALKMREQAGNKYQGLSLGGSLDIRIYATQQTSESDSFDNQYDGGAIFDEFADKSILTSQTKRLNEGAETVEYALYHKGKRIVGVSVPKDAIANPDEPISVTVRAIDSYIDSNENTQSYAYDIDVTNMKSDLKGAQLVTVVISAPKALAAMNVYHKNELISDAVYDEVAGTITFKTANFSPFEVTANVVTVETFGDLRKQMQFNGANIVLGENITVDLSKDSALRDKEHAYPNAENAKYYNGVKVQGKNVALDLNGHSITVFCGDKYNSNSDVGALFYVAEEGSLNINDSVGTGFIKMESSIYAVWAPYDNDKSYVDIYGGIFIADSYAGDSVAPGGANYNENSNRTLIYAGRGGNINVYGGYFLYNNTPDDNTNRNNGAFNAKDHYTGGPLITIHEGVYLANAEYRQNPANTSTPHGTFDNESIKLVDETLYGVVPVTETEAINGVNDWYKVSRKFAYKITFMNGDGTKVLDTQYIMPGEAVENVGEKFKGTLDQSYAEDFGGWVNTASEPISKIDADNDKDIVLYPTYQEKFIVRWLDENGNVIATQTVNKGAKFSELDWDNVDDPDSSSDEYLVFDHWELREVKNGKITYVEVSESDSSTIASDITLYPYYEYDSGNGRIGLTPHDTDGDGRPDYYTIESANGLSGEITIPGYVNGVQVTVITDLSGDWLNSGVTAIIIKDGVEEIGSEAFAMTSGLQRIEIPSTVTKIGANAFASTIGGALISKTPMLIYDGTWVEWDSVQKVNGWERGLASGTTVVCKDGTATLTASTFLGFGTYTWNFVSN